MSTKRSIKTESLKKTAGMATYKFEKLTLSWFCAIARRKEICTLNMKWHAHNDWIFAWIKQTRCDMIVS